MLNDALPKSDARMRILRHIYENPGISISGLIRKSKASPSVVMGYVNSLVDAGAAREKRIGGRKKTHIRQLYPDFSSDIGLIVFSIVEMEKRDSLLGKYGFLRPVRDDIRRLLEGTGSFCLLYGSYARLAAEKSSDVDILVVGNIPKHLSSMIREAFVTVDAELSLKLETKKKFLARIKDHFHQNVLRDHAVLSGEREFLMLLASADIFA